MLVVCNYYLLKYNVPIPDLFPHEKNQFHRRLEGIKYIQYEFMSSLGSKVLVEYVTIIKGQQESMSFCQIWQIHGNESLRCS